MIYLIGGAPRVGKSTIAKYLSEVLKVKLVSTDEIEYQNKEKSVIFYDDPKKNNITTDERTEAIIKESEGILPEVDKIIEKKLTQNEDIIIEGVHLLPEFVKKTIDQNGKENIKSIFIFSRDINLIIEGLLKNTSENNWPKDFRIEAKQQIATFSKNYSVFLYRECRQNKIQFIERSKAFRKDILKVINTLR